MIGMLMIIIMLFDFFIVYLKIAQKLSALEVNII